MFQMSTPPPVTAKVPADQVALPTKAGLPMSRAVHGTGSEPAVMTVKTFALLATLPTVTTTFPVVAPFGTAATMRVALQLVVVATVPLNRTVLLPCIAPKFVPVIVIAVPTVQDIGDRLVIVGA
jgi:hypothetical protein